MTRTENEARETRCCGPEGCGACGPDNSRWCIASDCMAWRSAGSIGIRPNGEKTARNMDGLTQWVETGYCGLAGEPK